MDFKQNAENLRNVPNRLARAAALTLSLLAAGHASAAMPGAAKQFEGKAAPPIAGSDKSGTQSNSMENLARAKQRWIQETFEKARGTVYEKGNENLLERKDPLGQGWVFFKVDFSDVGETNLVGCHAESGTCLNLKLPLDADDVVAEHRGFLEEASREAKVLPTLSKSAPDPESGNTWLAATIMQTEREGIFLLIRPDKMLDIAVSRGAAAEKAGPER